MPPKTSRSGARSGTGTGSRSRSGWKTGEQLQFLRSRFKGFKHAQDTKTLDRFWSKLLDDWYNSWPIPSSPSLAREYGTVEEARLMLQKEKNAVRDGSHLLHSHHTNLTLASKSRGGLTTSAVARIRSRHRAGI
jgi:hypothetical protein